MEVIRKKIILVDDSIVNRTIGEKILTKTYDAIILSSGEKLLKTLEITIPDLILLDIEMPNMSGYDVIKILKKTKRTKDIPVIFLTSRNDVDSEVEGFNLGAVDYILKPFSPSLFLKRIEAQLIFEEQRQELVHYSENLEHMVNEKTKSVMELQNAILKTMAELVECRDDNTGGHIERTQNYLDILVKALTRQKLHEEITSFWDINLLVQSAQLHDVGKVGVKDSILQKPGRLTEDEFEEMKKHTTFGVDIINKIEKNTTEKAFLNHARILAGTHHERWDGKGYPSGLMGGEIPLEGRIMAIADVYDALISERPYKKPFTHEAAVEIIKEGRGTQFDPEIVDLFLSVSEEFNEVAKSINNSLGIENKEIE